MDESLAIQQIQISGWARLPLGSPKSEWHLDFTLGDSPFDQSALQRRQQRQLFGRQVWVASPEDLMIYKLVSGRPQDLLDVRQIRDYQKDLDAAYLRRWADRWEQNGVPTLRTQVDALFTS